MVVALTPSSLFRIDYLPVPTELSDYVTTFYHFTCDEEVFRDIQPASIGHLALFPIGKGEMNFRDGRSDPSHEVNLLTPFSVAAPFEVRGGFHAIGAVLSPLGWACLTGLDADANGNRLLRAADVLGDEIEELGTRLCAEYRAGTRDGASCAAELGEYIGSHLRKITPRHVEVIKTTIRWLSSSLNPTVEELYAQLSYSERQVQRLVERYFGLAPQALLRKYRALRAATFLSLPQLAPEYEAQIGEAFYDQSHLIREIQTFVGRTPARLSDDQSPYLTELLDKRNFREIDPDGAGDQELL